MADQDNGITGEIRVDRLDLVAPHLALPGHTIQAVERTPAAITVDLSAFDHVVHVGDGVMWMWNDLPDDPDVRPHGLPEGCTEVGYLGDGQAWHRVPPKKR